MLYAHKDTQSGVFRANYHSLPSEAEPTHDLTRSPAFGSPGGLFQIPGSLSPSLKILRIIPKKQTYKRALQRRYLERGSVHACIQLCTRGYTVVYTRVYSSLLGRRYSLGISTPRTRILLSSAYAPPRPCPRTLVISCVSLGSRGEGEHPTDISSTFVPEFGWRSRHLGSTHRTLH